MAQALCCLNARERTIHNSGGCLVRERFVFGFAVGRSAPAVGGLASAMLEAYFGLMQKQFALRKNTRLCGTPPSFLVKAVNTTDDMTYHRPFRVSADKIDTSHWPYRYIPPLPTMVSTRKYGKVEFLQVEKNGTSRDFISIA